MVYCLLYSMVLSRVNLRVRICYRMCKRLDVNCARQKLCHSCVCRFQYGLRHCVTRKLSARLYAYGIQWPLLKWIQNFLTGRTHQTRIGCSLSEIADLLGGVVQGSGLGPVFYLSIYLSKKSRLGRRKCRDTTRAPNNVN